MPSSLESLYNQIKSTGVAGNSYGEFQQKMADSAYRQGLYKSLTKHGAKVGANLGEFEQKLGYGYVSPSARPEPMVAPKAQPQQPKMTEADAEKIVNDLAAEQVSTTPQKGGTQLTEQEKIAMSMGIADAQHAVDRSMKAADEMGKIPEMKVAGQGQAGLLFNKNLTKGPKSFNAETGMFEDTYMTTDGKSYTNPGEASSMQDVLDKQVDYMKFKENMEALGLGDITGESDKNINKRIEDAYAELENIDVEIDKRRNHQAFRLAQGMGLAGSHGTGTDQADKDLDNLLSAKRLLERRLKALEAERDDAGFWQGTGDTLFDPSSLSFGLTDLADSQAMKGIQQKIESAGGGMPNLSDSEKILARNYLMNQEAQQLNNNRGWLYGAGQGFGQTLSFMKDFALTGGGFASAAKAGMRMGTKAGLKYAGSDMAQFLTKNLGLTGKVLNKTLQYGAKYGGLAAGAEVGGVALANTAQLASTFSNIANRNIGTLSVDKEGKLEFKDAEDLGKAILYEELKASGENASELVGPAFDLIPGLMGRAIRNKFGGELLKKITSNKFWRGGEKTLDYLGVQSVFGEGMEEEYGMLRTEILNKITGGEMDPNAESITDLGTQLNTWATVGLTSVLLRAPQIVASGQQQAQYYGYKFNLNRSDHNMRNVFGDYDRYQSVKALLDASTNQNIGSAINALVSKGQLNDQEKEAVMFYAQDLINLRGYNIGTVLAASQVDKVMPRTASYRIQGNNVEELDQNGNVIAVHEYENRDAMKAGQYELLQKRFDQDLNSDINVLKARPGIEYYKMLIEYSVQVGMDTDEFDEILAKPSMERTDAEQKMVEPFAKLIHNTVYDNTMLHEDESALDGATAADNASIDMDNPQPTELQEANAAFMQASGNRRMVFDKNEDLKSDVLRMEDDEKLSHQEIIAKLETYSPAEQQAVIDYYNQKARYESAVNRINNKINEEAANSRQRHTFKGTINGQADLNNVHTITDGVNEYYLVSGNVTTDAEGRITGSTSGLIIGMDSDGSFVQIKDSDGFSVIPVTQSLDQFEEGERTTLQQLWTSAIDPTGSTMQPAADNPALSQNNEGVAENNGAVPQNGETPAAAPETPQGTALERIPKDEGGNPVYEQASPEDTYDALVEQVGEQSAKVLAKKQIDDATKNLARLQKQQEKGELKGKTIQEQIAEMQELQAAIDAEQGKINYWNSVLAVPNNRRLNEANNQPAGTPPTGAGTPPTPPVGGGENVPDWSVDKASDARARGYRITNGHRVDRQEPLTNIEKGDEIEVKFDKNEEPVKGFQVVVMDAGSLIPSHVNGQRNVLFFIDEAQPKDRTDVDSDASSSKIARDINPEEITGGVTAYTGSPVVNARGEVIQGNNRTIGLQKMWGSDSYAESQQKYKQYLIDHAAEFGIDPDEIASMKSPVLVRMIDVTDEEAIRLGQKTAANTESGGVERIDPMRVIQSMGDNVRVFVNLLFGQEVEGQTLMDMIAENGVTVLQWLNDGKNHPKYITDTQYQSCFDKKGNLTSEAKTDLKKIVEGLLFADAPDRLAEMFYNMPTKAQNAILATFWRDAQSPDAAKIIKDIQESIEAYAVISGASEEFRNAKDVNAARTAVKDLQKQTQMFGNTATVLEKFSNFALELAIMYKGEKQNKIRDYFNAYYDSVQGKGGNLFQEATTKTKEEAIKEIFGIETNNNTEENGDQGSSLVGNNGSTGQTGQRGSEGESGVGKPVAQGEQPATGGTGGNGGTLSEREQFIKDHPLTEDEIDASDASDAQKILAKQYLNQKDEWASELAKASYLLIYNKKVAAQNQSQQSETKPETPKSEQPATPKPKTPEKPQNEGGQGEGEQPTGNAAQAAARAKMAAALAKLKKHGKKNDQNTDAYSVEKLTPEQLNDMFDVLEAGAELGYTLLDGVESQEEWIGQMRDAIAEPLKDATGYTDEEVTELLNDMWNYPYNVEGETKTVGEWATQKGINVNENTNGTEEGNGNADVVGGTSSVDNTPEEGMGERPVVSGAAEGEPGSPTNSGTATTAEVPTGRGRSNGNAGRGTRGTTSGKPNVGRGLFDSPEDTGQESPANDTGRELGNNEPGNSGGQTTGTGEPTNPVVGQPERIGKKKPLADIAQEKAPYQPSSIGGKFAIGSVIPSGIADAIAKAFERLKKLFKKDTLDFVCEELGYKSNEEMLSDFESGKTDGLAAEQVDAVALAIKSMKEGKSFIVGDMTGVGKGRTAAALIRWGIKHGKKVVFVTEKSGLFSDMYRDLTDIGSSFMPFVTNSDTDANITDADGNKVIPKPSPAAQKALWQREDDQLPTDKKGKKYDFVMTTYSQVSSTEKGDQRKKEWLKNYAKDAIVIMDESHNASGESNTGRFFREIVQAASGVTFLSATYAKRPDNMLLYAVKSSMSKLNMSVGDMLQAIKDYGVAMQELMASYLFGSGEMIRRERDMTGVNTTWTDPKEIYSEEEYEECRKTSDKTMALVEDIIQFQRDIVNPIVKEREKDFDQQNKAAALMGAPQRHASNTAYKSQVSNIVGLMVYAMKAKKAAQMAIEQIKQGKKPVIAVDNTMESYIRELGEDIPEVNFRPIFEKGIRFSLKYMIADYEQGDDGKYHKVKGSEQYYNAEDELDEDGERALENLRQRVNDYFDDTDKIDLSLSPIDLIKKMIADAGYSCGEITGRSFELEERPEGGYLKKPFKSNKKEAARRFNGGSAEKPIPENEQYQALILNVAGATGISLHSSKKFGNQQPRTMIILQPAKDVNIEVQMRGRIDRTGQVHRGEYFYVSSPIPAEQKIMMMLKQKLASLDAQSVGTKEVSSNKVESQDMDNKYGDEVCKEFLLEHLQDINAFLEDGLQYNNKTREWEGRPGLLYDVLKNIQRMPCETQEMIINELTQRYADQINYLNQNGINDLETTTMDLEAVTIDKATFVKGKDNESDNEFEHDTTIERVEVNVLKKPMRSSDINKKMKDLDALDEDGIPKEGILRQTSEKVKETVDKLYKDREAKYEEKEKKHEEKLRKDHPKKEDQTDEQYEEMIQGWPSLQEMRNKDKADLMTYGANLQEQYNNIYKAAMYLKPGRPYLVPLTDDVSGDAPMMYGRFLGFQMKNGDPRQVQAVFAVKDSRAMITIPVVNQNKVIDKILQERNDMEIVALNRNPETYEDYTLEQRAKVWDEWWDKMIPKNTNRQIRYMITGNVVQACGSLGKYKGQIVTFTRKNKETGEITLERGMLLAENFDPENFQVRRAVTKKDVWENYDEIEDERSGISVHREGSHMAIKFNKRKGEKLKDHPAQSDEVLKGLIMNGELRPSKKDIVAVVKEENVEKALEHLYREYGYTKEELFVMPDSTEKPDAIVHTNKPYKEIIEQYKDKYGSSYYVVDSKIRKMLKRYKMDVNNDQLKEEIKEAVMLRQALLRQRYANKESNRLAWQVLIEDGYMERYKEDKDTREEHHRIKEAILEELEYRGFKGNTYHYTQGKITTDDVKKMFDTMNDESTPEGKAKKALFDKVMAKVEKLPMEIFMDEKLDNDTGGWAGGRIINYNWKYMNADYISDQAKADTILHELIHTVTAYADNCVERGEEHLLDQEMIDAVNELHGIFDAIKNDPTFEHDGEKAYGLTNVREMLSEAGSNSEFRNDLKKTNLWQKLWAGILKFFGIKQNVQGAKQVNAFDAVMLRLDYLIENFKQEAWEEFYRGTQYGGYGYQKMDAQKRGNSIADKEVKNVIVDTNKTKLPTNRNEALETVSKLNRPFINKDQNKEIIVTNSAVKHSATQGRENADTQCLGVIDQIISNAVKIGELPPKPEKKDTIERCEIYYCPVNIDGHQYSARLVVNQYKNRGRVLDDYQLYDLRTKEKTGIVSQATGQNALTSLSTPVSRYKVSDLVWNSKKEDKNLVGINNINTLFDEGNTSNQSPEKQHKSRIRKHIDKLAKKLGTQARTTVYHSLNQVPKDVREHIKEQHRRGKKVRGWYENGQVYLFLPDIDSEYEAEKTIWHETVAHHGLRQLIGEENMNQLLTQLWLEHKDKGMQEWCTERMQTNGWSLGEAIEEYLAREAEKEPFKDPSLWQRLKWLVAEALHKMGFTTDPIISDIQYLFWVSKNQLNDNDPASAMRQKAFQYRLEKAAEGTPNIDVETKGRRYDMDLGTAKDIYNDRLNRIETVFTEAYQDAMVSLKTAQNAIAKDQDIPDSQNAYMAENLMHGKNKNEMDLFNANYRDPMIATINKIMNLTGMNWGDIDRYVYTKSGLERNREFYVRDWLEAQRNAGNDVDAIESDWQAVKDSKYQELKNGNIDFTEYLSAMDSFIRRVIDNNYDPSEHDYSGFRAMFGEDYDEADIINELMNTEGQIEADNVNELWDEINRATRYGLERYREAGMRSDEQIDNVEQMFHFYVPMRGFKEDTGEDMYQYFSSKSKAKSYVGGLLKHAKGRGSEASYPISTIFAMSYKAIADCNQNLVNQKLYRLCQANPNDLVVLSDTWAVYNDITGEWEETMPPITDDMDDEEIRQTTLDFEKDMNNLASQGKAKKIKGKPNFDYVPMDKKKKSEHIIDVRINGQPKQMIVVSNPRMAQALNGQLRFERGKNVFSKWNAAIKNLMAALFTSYSPTFALRNMFRDWTHFRTMLGVREGHGYASAANKYYRQSLFKMVGLFDKYRKGTLDMNNEMERDFKDFMDNGGVTGFVQMQKVDDIQKQMEKLYKQQKEGKIIRLNDNIWMKILNAVEAMNEGIENNARFATFRASRHYANRTKARSAYDAKEITVNFNRKGAGSKTAGYKSTSKAVEDAAKAFGVTAQILGEGKIFFNATVQAIATTFKNFQNPDGSLNKPYIAKWAAKYALPPFMFGLLLPYINSVLAAALGGGDGDDPYANLPEWTRRKNICIYAGKHDGHDYFITIPIGQELAAFLTLGDIVAGNTYATDLKPLDRGYDEEALGVLNTFSPVDIDTKITKGGLMEDPISEVTGRTFSVLAPLVAVEQNLGWTGRPIYREDKFGTDKYTPEYQMVYSSTNPVLVNASKLLNDISGGDDVIHGKIQLNPGIVQYLWEQYTGGPGKFFSNTISIGKDAKDILAGGDSDFNIRKIEGLKAFVQQGDDRTQYYRTQAKYHKYLEDAEKLHDAVTGYQQAASTDPMAIPKLEKIMSGEDYVKMEIVRQADAQLSKINKAANKADGKERKELRMLYNQAIKEVVDMLDQVGQEAQKQEE